MFGIGGWELFIIAVVALLVLGPRKLPAAARAIGRVASELRRAAGDLRQSVELDPELRELPDALDEINRPIFHASPYPRKGGKRDPVPHPAYSAKQLDADADAEAESDGPPPLSNAPGPKDSPLELADAAPPEKKEPAAHVEKSSNRPSPAARDAEEPPAEKAD